MAFPVTGLAAAVAACKAAFAAIYTGPVADGVRTAYEQGFAAGLNYGAPIDHTTIPDLVTLTATASKFTGAMALDRNHATLVAEDTAADAAATAANTSRTTAITAAQAAIDAYNP